MVRPVESKTKGGGLAASQLLRAGLGWELSVIGKRCYGVWATV